MRAKLSQDDLYHAFEFLIKVNLNGFAFKRSLPTVKQAMYRWFKKYLNINLVGNGIIYIQNIVLNNAEIFSHLMDRAIRNYKPLKEEEINKKIEEIEEWNEEWEIVKSRNLNPYTYSKYAYNSSLYGPCYLKLDSNIEKEFIEYLEGKKDAVKWWWQNGDEHMSLNFGIKYNRKSTFQPDFIVMFDNARLGIFDTKTSGFNEDDNKLKGEALQRYFNGLKKNIFGGLVVKEGQHFRINTKEKYVGFKKNPDDWEYFDEVIK